MSVKIITLMIILIFSISLVSAITIYSGEMIIINLEKPYDYYSIVGNSTEVILDITQVGNVVTIIPDKYSQNDSYEVVFFDSEKETITVYQSSGGGGSTTKWKDKIIEKNVTKYVDREVIKEVPGETIEVEKIVGDFNWVLFGIVILLLCLLAYLFFKKDERGYVNNENKQESSFSSNDTFGNRFGNSS